MSVGDVLAHYRGGEGWAALLGLMEHATLESISIENSARHTHRQTFTDSGKKIHTHSTLAFPHRCLTLITFW